MVKNRTVVHVFLSPIEHESRLIKEANSVLAAEVVDQVIVFGLWRTGLLETEPKESIASIHRIRLRTQRLSNGIFPQLLKYLEWAFKVLRGISRVDGARVLHAHSLAALPVVMLAKLLYADAVVYDAHELESERNGLVGIRKSLTRWAERLLIRKVDMVMVVGEGIADWYENAYRLPRPQVVRNVPMPSPVAGQSSNLRARLGIKADDILFLYLGVLGPGRSIEKLCQAFAAARQDRNLVFLGYGSLENVVRDWAARHQNIHFAGSVPPAEVLANMSNADVGVCLIEDVCLSYRLSLPNKLFQSLLAGVPVMINALPEQAGFVNDSDCGWIVPASTAGLTEMINVIDRRAIDECRPRVAAVAKSLDWQKEITPYIDFCRQVFASSVRH